MERNTLIECVDYFHQNKAFHRLLLLMKEKIESLGRIGGTVRLEELNDEEREAFTAFFRKDFTKNTEARISLQDFRKSLESSRFQSVLIPELLEMYFNSPVIFKKDKELCSEILKNDFFIHIALEFEGTKAEEWLLDVYTRKNNAYMTIIGGYNESPALLQKELKAVCKAIVHLPFQNNKYKSLPVFAAEMTKDPHAFDINTRAGRLLQYAIAWLFSRNVADSPEEKAEMYYHAGLMIDDLSNQVLCCGFEACADGEPHGGWSGFSKKWQPISIPLAALSQVNKLTAPNGRVLVVENPSIFNLLSEPCREKRTALVCTFGQPNLAVYVLLDMAVNNGAKLFYSGDMDPEGLLIADRLKDRYGDNLNLKGYSPEVYYKSISNIALSEPRIKKMKSICDPDLRIIAQAIAETGKAAYQEAFVRVNGDTLFI
jgi:uncharacterized protein (TIGR02679 family)